MASYISKKFTRKFFLESEMETDKQKQHTTPNIRKEKTGIDYMSVWPQSGQLIYFF